MIAQSKLHTELDTIRKMERKTHLINEYQSQWIKAIQEKQLKE
jgi:hypothetical protein